MNRWPPWVDDWLATVVPMAEVLAILGVAWLLVRALAWLLLAARRRGRLAPELHVGLRRGGALLLYLAAALLVLERLGVSRSVLWTALTGFMAVGAVAFFAAWSVLSNLFCSFLIVATRPFRINDTIEVLDSVDKPGLCGQVVDINLIYTTLSDHGEGVRGCLVRVPNSLFFQRITRHRGDGRAPIG
ncbi:mechanosensitive ion channel domain-containing protein [Stenotrophomonas maltophilia]|uniref:mechanosensitive ion channel domain-containing protein n=1 Tax=Stenotrophomonas maltophilia TaxID=40324 RepID=UPI0006AC7E41|nr:mechanosensitive ion channel domain-containing protein [Stenotrophomonas maltophilia]KOQ71341.1 mechanosensitive ion channel protein MscS [Stenotrophomonas maltophilia]